MECATASTVAGESLYEAAVVGLNALRNDGWVEVIALGTTLEVQVREPADEPFRVGRAVEALVRRHRGEPRRGAQEAQVEGIIVISGTESPSPIDLPTLRL